MRPCQRNRFPNLVNGRGEFSDAPPSGGWRYFLKRGLREQLYLLSQRDVSLIWPLTALGFVVTAIAAKFILKEEVSALRWAGVALIVIGASLVTYSEKAKAKSPELATQNSPVLAKPE